MLRQQLFPDLVVVMMAKASDVRKRLLPRHLDKWRERRDRREAQRTLLRNQYHQRQVSDDCRLHRCWYGCRTFSQWGNFVKGIFGGPESVFFLRSSGVTQKVTGG